MPCPNCGLMLDGMPASCPRCGQLFAQQLSEPQEQGAPASVPPGIYPPSYLPSYWPGHTVPPGTLPSTSAPPSYPAYPPSYQPYPLPLSFSYPLAEAGTPVSTPRRPNTAFLIVASLVCAVVLVTAGAVGGLTLAYRLGSTCAGSVPPTSFMPSATATATATATPAANVLYQNTLRSRAPGWTNNKYCSFQSDGYHVKGFHLCPPPLGDQTDLDITVTAKQLIGSINEPYGIAFRLNGNPDRYEFDIASNGYWVFFKCIAGQKLCQYVVRYRFHLAIEIGPRQSNTLEVRMQGSHFVFFVNGAQVGTADDTTLPRAGEVALQAAGNAEVVFTDLTIAAVD